MLLIVNDPVQPLETYVLIESSVTASVAELRLSSTVISLLRDGGLTFGI